MASYSASPATRRFSVRVFGPDGAACLFVGQLESQSEAAERAEGLVIFGEHARIYDAAGNECGRVYAGADEDEEN